MQKKGFVVRALCLVTIPILAKAAHIYSYGVSNNALLKCANCRTSKRTLVHKTTTNTPATTNSDTNAASSNNANVSANTPTPSLFKGLEGINPQAFTLAVKAYEHAKQKGMVAKDLLTIVDFTKPSNEKRLWVLNMATHQVMYHTLVAQGKNSGLVKATHFSNDVGSLESSLGAFVTSQPYTGNDGYSLKLIGLENGINDNAEKRDIVMHPAWYVTPSFAQQNGRVGRSWGCFAVNPKLAPEIINTIKGGSMIFAYAPQDDNDPLATTGHA